GFAVWGAAIGGVLGGFLVALRRTDIPIGATADAAAAGLSLGFAIGRIGDIINGEHHAIACNGIGLCVGFTNPATLGQPGPVHLVVAYDMIWDLLGVALVLLLMRTALARAPQGRIFWTWVLWYALGRFMLGFLRVGDPTPILGLRQDQLVAVIAATVALPALVLVQTNVLPRVLELIPRPRPRPRRADRIDDRRPDRRAPAAATRRSHARRLGDRDRGGARDRPDRRRHQRRASRDRVRRPSLVRALHVARHSRPDDVRPSGRDL